MARRTRPLLLQEQREALPERLLWLLLLLLLLLLVVVVVAARYCLWFALLVRPAP
jgi:hypothetical protein